MNEWKALLHIDDAGRWRTVLANAKTLIEDIGADELKLEIVVNATAVSIFDATDKENNQVMRRLFLEAMKELAAQGVTVVVCKNALKANAVPEDGVPEFVTIMPAAISHLVKRQADGYGYVKP